MNRGIDQIAFSARLVGRLALLGVLALSAIAGPSNDSWTAPAPLPGIEGIQTVQLAGATVEPNEPYHLHPWANGTAVRSLWYVWRAPEDGALLLSVEGSAAASAFATALDSTDSFAAGGPGLAIGERPGIEAVLAGRTYLVVVGDQTGAPDEVTLSWRFLRNPDNDRWARRQILPPDGTPVPGWPSLTRPDDLEVRIGAGNLVWYEWTAPAAGRAVAEFIPSFPDGRGSPLLVFREGGDLPGIEVQWPDSGLPVVASELLRIGVKASDTTPGPFQLGVRLETARLVFHPANPVDTDPTIQLRAEVTAFDGEIREVEFYRDGQRFAVDSTSPYEVTLGSMEVGQMNIRAALVRRDGSVQWVPAETLVIRPSNDHFASATILTGEHATDTVDVATATPEPDEPDHGGSPAARSVWWSWTPPHSGVARLYVSPAEPLGLTFSMEAAVYAGDSLASLRPILATDVNYLWFPVTGGVPYSIAFDSSSWWVTKFTVELDLAPPLPNDAFAAATPLTGEQLDVVAPGGAATVEPGEPAPNSRGIHSLWWTWSAPADGYVTLQSGADAIPTTVEAYAGDSLERLIRLQPEAGGGLIRWPATTGTQLKIRALPNRQGELWVSFNLNFERPPANDFLANATVIDLLPFHLTGNLLDATAEPGEPPHGSNPPTRTVWYRWTPSESGPVALEKLDDSNGYQVAVYREGERIFLWGLWAAGTRFLGDFSAGTTYWLVIDATPGGSDLSFSLNLLPPPPNDALSSVIELPGQGVHLHGSALLATREPGEPVFGPNAPGQTVWYGWTAPETGLATVLVKSVQPVLTAVFTGDDVSGLKPAEPVWNSVGEEGVRTVFSAVAGTHYWIGVDASKPTGLPGDSNSGRFELRLGLSQLQLVAPAESVALQEGSELKVEGSLPAGQEGELATWQFRLGGQWHPEATSPLFTTPPMRHTYSNLAAGNYTITVVGADTNGTPYSSRSVAFRVAPVNDAIVDATLIPQIPCFLNGVFEGASEEAGEPVLAEQTATGSRWWTWVAPRSGLISVELHCALGIFVRTSSGALEPVASFGHGGPLTSTGSFAVAAGQTYLLKVAPRKTPETSAEAVEYFSFTLAWNPEHDSFAEPRILEGTQLHLSLDHTAASTEPNEPVSGLQAPRRSLWHAWTAPADGWLLLKGGPVVSVFTGSNLAALTPVPAMSRDPEWPFRFPVQGGETYRISFDYFESTRSVKLAEWELRFVGPQAHDAFAGRLSVNGLPAVLTGINFGATREASEPTRQIEPWNGQPFGPIGSTLWFAWTSPVSGQVVIRPFPSSSPVLTDVFTGDHLETLRSLRPDAPLLGLTGGFSFVAEAGRTYAISVGCLAGQEGVFHLQILGPPPNDEFATATVVAPDAAEIPVNVFLATVNPTDPEPALDGYGSVWFRWTAPTRGRVTLNLSPWDNYLDPSVWIGDRLGDLRRLDGPDRRGQFRADAGSTYYFFIRGYPDSQFALPLVLEPPLPNDDFAEAIRLMGTEIETGGETRGATAEVDETERSVWWRWTAPSHGQLWVTALTGEPPALFRGPSVRQLTRQIELPDGSYRVHPGQELFLRARYTREQELVRFRLRFSPDPAAELTGVGSVDGLHLTLRARPGQTVELERSTDLETWLHAGRHWVLFPEETWAWPVGSLKQEFLRERSP